MWRTRIAGAIAVLVLLVLVAPSNAQVTSLADMFEQVRELIRQDKKLDAIPILEKIIERSPDDDEPHMMLGDALLAKSLHVTDQAERKALRKRAREEFQKALDLGGDGGYLRAMISTIPEDGSSNLKYSSVPASDAATLAGEQAFTTGKIDDALGHYKRALELDPKNYFAALFAGDMYLKKEDFGNAEIWYQKAIAIDPFTETAYRYSATPLMRQKKFDQARDRYIDAWITDPYNRFSVNGMVMWGRATNTDLSHPTIDVPKTEIGADGKTKTTLNINMLSDDGSMAWISYSATAETWRKEKFRKTFPNEKTYRRSLAEEADRLRSVLSLAKTLKAKKLDPQIAMIEKLDQDGVLEAFILMSYGDEEIHKDHRAYLTANRDKMRQYVLKYVIKGN